MAKEMALSIKKGTVTLTTTDTKVVVTEEAVDDKILQQKIDNFNQHIANAEKEQIRIQSIVSAKIAELRKQIIQFQEEISNIQKQVDNYWKLELPKDEKLES